MSSQKKHLHSFASTRRETMLPSQAIPQNDAKRAKEKRDALTG